MYIAHSLKNIKSITPLLSPTPTHTHTHTETPSRISKIFINQVGLKFGINSTSMHPKKCIYIYKIILPPPLLLIFLIKFIIIWYMLICPNKFGLKKKFYFFDNFLKCLTFFKRKPNSVPLAMQYLLHENHHAWSQNSIVSAASHTIETILPGIKVKSSDEPPFK